MNTGDIPSPEQSRSPRASHERRSSPHFRRLPRRAVFLPPLCFQRRSTAGRGSVAKAACQPRIRKDSRTREHVDPALLAMERLLTLADGWTEIALIVQHGLYGEHTEGASLSSNRIPQILRVEIEKARDRIQKDYPSRKVVSRITV